MNASNEPAGTGAVALVRDSSDIAATVTSFATQTR
jgi:hypothetical protein